MICSKHRLVSALCSVLAVSACYTNTQSSVLDFGGSSAGPSPANLVGDGTSTVTVALETSAGVPIVGSIVQVSVDGCDVTQPSSPTRANGTATASVLSCEKPGQHAVSVEVTSGARQLAVPVTATLKSVAPATAGGHDVQAGFPLNAYVVLQRPDGSPNIAFSGTVHFISSDAAAILPADTTFDVTEKGAKAWVDGVIFRTAGKQSLSAVDTGSGATVLNETYMVTPGPAGALLVTQRPYQVDAGSPFQVTVAATDSTGAPLPGYTGTVGFSSSDIAAILPTAVPFLPSDAGKKTFTLVLKTAGAQSFQATDGSIASVPQDVSVTAGSAAKLRLLAPAQFVAGVGQPVTVQSTDAYGNVVPTYSGTVHFSSTDPNINLTSTDPNVRSLPVDTAFNGNNTGTMTFSRVSLVSAGQQSITVTDTQDSNFTNTASGIVVVGGTAVNWALSADAANWAAGVPTTATVTALDTYSNPATLYRGVIKFTSTDPNAVLPANYTFNANDQGVRVYNQGVTWVHSGNQTLSVSDFVAHRGSSVSGVVPPNVVTALRLSDYDSPAYVAKDANVTVAAVDAWGNVNPSFTGAVHFTSTDPNAVLPADVTFQGTNRGVVSTGTLRFNNYGMQQLVATSTSSTLSGNANIVVHQLQRLVSNGSASTCAIADGGDVRCWGQNANNFSDCSACNGGQLGLGDTTDRGSSANSMGANLPDVDLGAGRTALSIVGGSAHRCALLDNKTVKCWGDNQYAELGLGDTISRGGSPNTMGSALPTVFLGAGRTAKSIWAGRSATCVRTDTDALRCWGYNHDGELGVGDANNRGDTHLSMQTLPAVNLGTGRIVSSMALGNYHSCALLDNAAVKCWGYNGQGQLGLGDTVNRGTNPGDMGDNLPALSLGTGRTALYLTAGRGHTCAVLDNQQIKCWGYGGDGELGYEDTTNRGAQSNQMGDNLPFVNLGTGRTVALMSSGLVHNCVVLDNGDVKCWGQNTDGRLGLGNSRTYGASAGTMGDSLPSVILPVDRSALQIMSGGYHTCIRTDNNLAYCWGNNQQGQAGLANNSTGNLGVLPGDMGAGLHPVQLW